MKKNLNIRPSFSPFVNVLELPLHSALIKSFNKNNCNKTQHDGFLPHLSQGASFYRGSELGALFVTSCISPGILHSFGTTIGCQTPPF